MGRSRTLVQGGGGGVWCLARGHPCSHPSWNVTLERGQHLWPGCVARSSRCETEARGASLGDSSGVFVCCLPVAPINRRAFRNSLLHQRQLAKAGVRHGVPPRPFPPFPLSCRAAVRLSMLRCARVARAALFVYFDVSPAPTPAAPVARCSGFCFPAPSAPQRRALLQLQQPRLRSAAPLSLPCSGSPGFLSSRARRHGGRGAGVPGAAALRRVGGRDAGPRRLIDAAVHDSRANSCDFVCLPIVKAALAAGGGDEAAAALAQLSQRRWPRRPC